MTITGRIATYNFAPTEFAKKNLLNENVKPENIFVTGNTVIDALFLVLGKIKGSENLQAELKNKIEGFGYPNIERLDRKGKKLILITSHRRENFGGGFVNMCNAVKTLKEK